LSRDSSRAVSDIRDCEKEEDEFRVISREGPEIRGASRARSV